MSSKKGVTSTRLPSNDVADCILFLSKCQACHLFGCVALTRVTGSLSIYGHNLADGEWHSVCSSGPCLISLTCGGSGDQPVRLASVVNALNNEKNKVVVKKVAKKIKNIGCILLLKSTCLAEKLQCKDKFDLSSVLDVTNPDNCQKELYDKTCDLNFALFIDVPAPLSPMILTKEWKDTVGSIEHCLLAKGTPTCVFPVILICGGKDVGKSTFARYVVNRLLSYEKPLYFLETDVGQSEFTPPGVLSLNKIEAPIFGPPFSHLSRPLKAFFLGDVSPRDHPSTYIRFIYALHRYYKANYSGSPLIVNTHGWVNGMGVWILLDIVRIVEPTHIIQINSEAQPTRNPPELTKDFLENETGWNYSMNEEMGWKCSSHIHQMAAFKCPAEGAKGISFQPKELRSLSLLSYFGSLQSSSSVEPVQDHILDKCPVYPRAISTLKLYNVSTDVPLSQTLYSINGSVVGLVATNTDMTDSGDSFVWDSCSSNHVPFGEYIGLGIIRNIDPSNDMLYIISPESPDNLRRVNALVKGRLEILDSLAKKRKCETEPYLTSEFTYNHRGSGQKRVRRNLLRQRSRSPRATEKS